MLEVSKKEEKKILFLIVLSQFLGTSVWFASNSVMNELGQAFSLEAGDMAFLTSLVQFGFIIGTLFFSVFNIPEKFKPNHLFMICTNIAGICTMALFFMPSKEYLYFLRFITGVALAGIYPVGMIIASSWFKEGLGKAMGWLVGALVLGTAFPFAFSFFKTLVKPHEVLWYTGILCIGGGVLMKYFVGVGPFLKTTNSKLKISSFLEGFQNKDFRVAAIGYWGHMWELYSFWAFLPIFIQKYYFENNISTSDFMSETSLTFIVISSGVLGCVLGGYQSIKTGSFAVGKFFLAISLLCAVCSPVMFQVPLWLLVCFLLIYGVSVVGDSPQFSTLIAKHAPSYLVGSSVTFVTAIGFWISITSIIMVDQLQGFIGSEYVFFVLFPGPFLSLSYFAIKRK